MTDGSLLYLSLACVVALAALVIWQFGGSRPRMRRAVTRARLLLKQGNWSAALEQVRRVRIGPAVSAYWQKRCDVLEGECLRAGAAESLAKKDFEEALGRGLKADELFGKAGDDTRASIQAAMLEELRRVTAVASLGQTAAVHDLVGRILLFDSNCREAYFWQALAFLHDGQYEQATGALMSARTGIAKSLTDVEETSTKVSGTFIDPPLYLGAVLLKEGKAEEAVRHLSEANRIDGNCPVVTVQLGAAIIAAGGDASLGVRALQRALGPKGLRAWDDHVDRFWIEAFPERHSYIRTLATKHPFRCPLWGSDTQTLTRQARLALAQGQYRLGNYPEAATLFEGAMSEGAPSLPILRGLGLSLARMEKYDDAFKHLRTAHEMAYSKDRMTAGYLALCGAKGKPKQSEDRARNLEWALKLVQQFTAPGDAEWIKLISAIYAEARSQGQTLSGDDQLYLCEHLASIQATDADAARAYLHLQATFPQLVRPEYAWLFCRAALDTDVSSRDALELFALTFVDPESARAFYAEKSWNYDEIELKYLELAATFSPGRFPSALGLDYPKRGAALLLDRSTTLEKAGKLDEAVAAIDVLSRLDPDNASLLERLSSLYYRRGNSLRAVELLRNWQKLAPEDPRPLVRQAVLSYQDDKLSSGQELLRRALGITTDSRHASLAFLAARMTLRKIIDARDDEASWQFIHEMLQVCLQTDPAHTGALWLNAAVNLYRNRTDLANDRVADLENTNDSRLLYFASIARLGNNENEEAYSAASRLGQDTSTRQGAKKSIDWRAEAGYLEGLSHLGKGAPTGAAAAFEKAAASELSPSANLARAHLGSIHFDAGSATLASHWWQKIDEGQRMQWGLAAPLSGAIYLSGLEHYAAGDFDTAAQTIKQAGTLGFRDKRMGPLLVLSLFRAGQKAFYVEKSTAHAARSLEQAVRAGFQDPQAYYLLAMCLKREGKVSDARRYLQKMSAPDDNVLLQRGILAFQERDYVQAAEDFANSSRQQPSSYAAAYDLILARLCLGQRDLSADLIAQALPLARDPHESRFLSLLRALLRSTSPHSVMSNPARDAEQELSIAGMNGAEEKRFLDLLAGVPSFDIVFPLYSQLFALRPQSPAIFRGYLEIAMAQGKHLIDRCLWDDAFALLAGLARRCDGQAEKLDNMTRYALFNMLAVSAALLQDYQRAAQFFRSAHESLQQEQWDSPESPRLVSAQGVYLGVWLEQNLALVAEWQSRLDQAEIHWNRYFDLMEHCLPKSRPPDYLPRLSREAVLRLTDVFSRKEKWNTALSFLQRGVRLRPDDNDLLERLFHLYAQLRRFDEARRTLRRLREARPNDPQVDLFELEVREAKQPEDVERLLADLRKVVKKHADDPRVNERGAAVVHTLIPTIERLGERTTTQMNKIVDQMKRLPSNQVNWTAVRDVMRDLEDRYSYLKQLAQMALPFVQIDEMRRDLQSFIQHCIRKIEQCHTLTE